MKKLLMTVLMLVGVATFAGVVEPFKQFKEGDFTFLSRNEDKQDSFTQSMMTLSVGAGSGVWLSNYVDHWQLGSPIWNPNPVADLHGYAYDMKGNQKYGYINKNDLEKIADKKGVGLDKLQKSDYQDVIKWANGDSMKVEYNDDNGNYNVTQAYFLDYFDAKADIYLVLTTLEADGGEVVDAYQYVKGEEPNAYDTTLVSRKITSDAKDENGMYVTQYDFAGNVRINYGLVTDGREFVAIYDNGTYSSELERASYAGSTGGPLPGVFFAGLLSLGTVFGASKAKRQKRA